MSSSLTSPLEVYTPIVEILAELEKRKNNRLLAQKVKEFWGEIPNFLKSENARHAFFSRPIITPNTELKYLLDIIPLFGLSPFFLEYPSKFVLRNQDKRSLAELCFIKDFDKNPRAKRECLRIVDFKKWEGKNLTDVETIWGENLRSFHRTLLFDEVPEVVNNIVDFSEWFNIARQENGFYYLKFLSLFIRNGVLFENFLGNDADENSFFQEKVAPSFKKATEIFGVKPLIFPLLPIRDEKNAVWLAYSQTTKNKIKPKKVLGPLPVEVTA